MKFSSLNKRFIGFCLRKKLGRTNFSVKVIYFITSILGRFEVYKNSQDFKKRGHYIPQLLLRRFRLSESKGDPKRNKTYQYSFLNNSVTEEKIDNVAQIEDFYIFNQKGGGKSDYVEKVILADWIENFGSQVIKTINMAVGDPNLTIFEQNVLATFVSHQITRTPTFYVQLRKYISLLYEKDLLKIEDLGNPNFLEEVIVKNKHNLTYDDLVDYVPKYTISGDVNHLGHLARLIAGEIMEDVFKHNFYFLVIPEETNEEFVISDNPVVYIDFKRSETKRYVDWWSKRSEDVWIFLPLSPKKSLLLTTKKKIDGSMEMDNSDMSTMVNFGQYLNALNFVYGRNQNLMQEYLKKFLPELIRYKTLVADPAVILK